MSNDFDIRKALAFTRHPSVVSKLDPKQREAIQAFARSLVEGGTFRVELSNGYILDKFSPRRFNFAESQVVGINGASIQVLKFSQIGHASPNR